MNRNNLPGIRLQEDVALFREALSFTAARTAFPAALIEKDYFCTVLLAYLGSVAGDHVFKGGTCLAKVYGEFYRLSEDMDFAIPMRPEASRAERRKKIATLKDAISILPKDAGCFDAVEPLQGANDSTPYGTKIRPARNSRLGRWLRMGIPGPFGLPSEAMSRYHAGHDLPDVAVHRGGVCRVAESPPRQIHPGPTPQWLSPMARGGANGQGSGQIRCSGRQTQRAMTI